jgi:hypothetical protein
MDSITKSKSVKRVTVDFLSEELVFISKNYSEYAAHAKANLMARYIFSKIRGHDLIRIKYAIYLMKEIKISPYLLLKSCMYFSAQKLSFRWVGFFNRRTGFSHMLE